MPASPSQRRRAGKGPHLRRAREIHEHLEDIRAQAVNRRERKLLRRGVNVATRRRSPLSPRDRINKQMVSDCIRKSLKLAKGHLSELLSSDYTRHPVPHHVAQEVFKFLKVKDIEEIFQVPDASQLSRQAGDVLIRIMDEDEYEGLRRWYDGYGLTKKQIREINADWVGLYMEEMKKARDEKRRKNNVITVSDSDDDGDEESSDGEAEQVERDGGEEQEGSYSDGDEEWNTTLPLRPAAPQDNATEMVVDNGGDAE